MKVDYMNLKYGEGKQKTDKLIRERFWRRDAAAFLILTILPKPVSADKYRVRQVNRKQFVILKWKYIFNIHFKSYYIFSFFKKEYFNKI